MLFNLIVLGQGLSSFPPAARTLSVLVAVYSILTAAKLNPWIKGHMKGWYSVVFNLVLSVLGLLVVVPADQLYSLNTLVSVVVALLGSSGLHGMQKSIPPTKQENV